MTESFTYDFNCCSIIDCEWCGFTSRMYDPVMSSFLSVDNYVQSPENSQNFNRYAYCLNNPLRYTDPSGECIALSIFAGASFGEGILTGLKAGCIGALTGGLMRGLSDAFAGYDFWDGAKVIDFADNKIRLYELYPNDRFNYDEYQKYSSCADYRLNVRTQSIYDFGNGDSNLEIDLLTTRPESRFTEGYTLNPDGTYTNSKGIPSFGYTVQTTAGYSEIHVSPFASLHQNEAIFRAVVGHELTHAYHFLDPSLIVNQEGPSERAALMYSKSVYDNYGMTNVSIATKNHIEQLPWNNAYRVPEVYPFAPH